MTTKRWLDELSDADGFERSVLASGLDAAPPPHAEDEVWKRLLVAVPPPLGPGPGGGAAGGSAGVATITKSATLATLGKGFLLGVAASVAVAGVDRLSHETRSARERSVGSSLASASAVARSEPIGAIAQNATHELPVPRVSVHSTPAELSEGTRRSTLPGRTLGAAALEAEPPPVATAVSTGSSVAAFPISDTATPALRSRLDEEAALLRKARSELRAGALATAFATLEASRERFSAPELYQEREALLIELLSRSGQVERARERARSFLARFPESPHAAAVRAFAEQSR